MIRLIAVVALAGAATLAIRSVPDIKRYLKMRSM
jgi:hypothetical protein